MSRKTQKKLTVGVIFGGRSGEHEVSLVSAASVIKALDKKKYRVVQIGIAKDGAWVTQKPMAALKSGKPAKQGSRLMPERVLNRCDVVFPVLHGSYGEDGTVQGMLEMANVAYVGGGVLGSAAAMDKVVQKQLCDQAGLPSVNYVWFLSKDWRKNKPAILQRINYKLRYPMFTKPANLGSSVGIGKCHDRQELIAGINDAARYDRKVIVEQGIEPMHEIEVAVLGNDHPRASVPGEIVSSNEFYDYDAKYVDGKSQAVIPAKLPQSVKREIQRIAVLAFKVLDLSGMARVDFLVKRGSYKVYLNEVNTIPGFTSISMYPKLWAASGVPYPQLLDRLITLALERYREKAALATSYRPKEDWYK
ncbi:MAG: D-alanine--D-alanine ligase A [Candidatus Buchananbacteria bacterium RIFCSPLOWO2_01_FULL_56_15]|uniref:D-alanine--D-alanine ligase n=2 Tax=Candidatus Buchananiibacteriota TaxID=1817903 RepID=A0A1G1YHG6_9BACT|nr:MAG: D-alanine--D-alanine ligase A [Candidatus Buchananbacteria bacterium RIFCSPHIGHO2_02_FULL_56_16]OGY54792.1 MAG: D-alanine--D-alanine ligase A [Candidatus Buchananbacteria bacterium RIFCSPLOWO2_01_FULL_56_15]